MLIAYCLENNYTQSYKIRYTLEKKKTTMHRISTTKYEKLDVYTHNLQNNYSKLENTIYFKNYEQLTTKNSQR